MTHWSWGSASARSSQLQDLLDLLLMDYRKMLGIETRRKSTFLDLKDAQGGVASLANARNTRRTE